jgi:hypothetical protein
MPGKRLKYGFRVQSLNAGKGRKPKQDSRADEIRAKLIEWKEKPEAACSRERF